MTRERLFAPEWCSAETMGYLMDIGASTFRSYVRQGKLPEGRSFEGIVRWHRERTLAAFEGVTSSGIVSAMPMPSNDNVDPIMAGIQAHGASKKGRGATPAARSRRHG